MADELVVATNRSRISALQEKLLPQEQKDFTFADSPDTLGNLRGLENPYGEGVSAYEPNTTMWDGGYRKAYNAVQKSKEAEKQDDVLQIDAPEPDMGMVMGDATGKIGAAINAAMDLANRRVPYVWGGTTRNGVDCSGLIQYAFKAAGMTDWPRYRAVDYGKMGQQVSAQDARPGDIVYFDNPGDVDHVGIYIGNGKMIQAPTTGDVVRVTNVGKATSYRRIFDDAAFTQIATPEGGAYWSYGSNGNQTQQWAAATPTAAPPRNIRPTTSYGRNF